MAERIIRSLQGYFFIIILNGNIFNEASDCKYEVENLNGTLTVTFSSKQTCNEIPRDLDENIEHLDMSGTTFVSLMTSDTFKRYSKLKWLSLSGCTFKNPDPNKNLNKDQEVFKPLEKLEYLDISALNQLGFPNYVWPTNIKILKVNKTGIPKKLDVSSISMLEYVDVSDTEITSFPLLDPKALVRTVILNNVNALFTAEDIASYCHITMLEMTLGPKSELLKSVHYCDCMRLNSWLNKCKIISTLLRCVKDEQHPDNCDLTDKGFSDCNMERVRCFGLFSRSSSPIVIFSVVFLIILILITTAVAYRYASVHHRLKLEHERHAKMLAEAEDDLDEYDEEDMQGPV